MGGFFIDWDGKSFKHILNYLRCADHVKGFGLLHPQKLQELCFADFLGLEDLFSQLKLLVRERDVVTQSEIQSKLMPCNGTYYTDYHVHMLNHPIEIQYYLKNEMIFECKNMRQLSFENVRFACKVLLIDCDLTNTSFIHCCFESDAIFQDCILDNTKFKYIKGLINNSSFTGLKIDYTGVLSNPVM